MSLTDPNVSLIKHNTPEVLAIRTVLLALHTVGIAAVCCGGSARDAYHFRHPKDLDFIVLSNPEETDVPPEYDGDTVVDVLRKITAFDSVQLFSEYRAVKSSGGHQVHWVVKAECNGIPVDIICPAKTCYTESDAVTNLDCTLNAAWFEPRGDGTCAVHVHPGLYPDLQDDIPVRLLYPKSCTAERIEYLKAKYPQYRYDINPDELLKDDICGEN